jgi:energy-coupling factor transporter ATP-binding protein EcfA2
LAEETLLSLRRASLSRLLGQDLAALRTKDIAARVGYVFQNPDHQFVTDRVEDEIAYGLRVRDYRDEVIAERVSEVLSIVDLQQYRQRSPFSLSLGERRRLSVATMLALEPKLLILDERTIGQDHERARQLMGLMVRLRERYQTTVLMITHDVRLVADWADRALVLHEGVLRFDGTPAELFAQSALPDEAGLIPPPIHTLSAELARRHAQAVPHPTLSAAELVGWLAAAPANAAAAPIGSRAHGRRHRFPVPGRQLAMPPARSADQACRLVRGFVPRLRRLYRLGSDRRLCGRVVHRARYSA